MTVKDRMGYQYFEVQTNAGKREFALRDASRNIRYINPEKRGAVQIRDIDGNRYLIDDFDDFDDECDCEDCDCEEGFDFGDEEGGLSAASLEMHVENVDSDAVIARLLAELRTP